jgi:primosomal protein N'
MLRKAVDAEPLLPSPIVELCRWVADYYVAGIGDALAVAMPPGARGRATAFKKRRTATVSAQGLDAARGTSQNVESAHARNLTTRQSAALEILLAAPGGLPTSELRDRGVTPAVLAALAKRGLVVLSDERDDRDPFERAAMADVVPDATRQLTGEQQRASDELFALADAGEFRVALLHGVTGSGKTEIYLRLADRVRRSGRQVLLMVPEIALTPSLAALVRGAFGDRVAIQHSALSAGERHDQWHRIRRNEIDVVVGTRSAVFAPLDRIGLIVVDEEHDSSYKQEETPRYHGRDVAIMRGSRERALVVLGSATPSMESYNNAASGKYARISPRAARPRPSPCGRSTRQHEDRVRRGRPGSRDQQRPRGRYWRPGRARRPGADPAESPRLFNRRVLPPVWRHLRMSELQRVAHGSPHPRRKRPRRLACALSLLQLLDTRADCMPKMRGALPRARRVRHRAHRRAAARAVS